MNWSIRVSENAPLQYNEVKYLEKVKSSVEPYIRHIIERIDMLGFVDEMIISEIVDEIPILIPHRSNDKFCMKYNSFVYIHFDDSFQVMNREKKINKLLKNE